MNWTENKTLVILKFHYGQRGSINPIISKTMGRVAVISHSYQGAMPQPGTFWLCEIERELGEDKPNGCFVVKPVQHVPLQQIMKLVPGAYDTAIVGSKVICRPKVNDCYWIIPFSLKKYFIKKEKAQVQYQSVIVPVSFTALSHP